ncbi:MAG: glucose-6-phosphate isomerase, partial [Flavobacteriales bacterium]|nr:glucose-6-phosphate isomerase [Flavobacteriales bacterium]
MSFPSVNPTTTKAWALLQKHFSEIKNMKMQKLFAEDSARAEKFSVSWEDFYLDYSKNRITGETLDLLIQLAEEVNLKNAIDEQFSGENINRTEDRAVLHTALRNFEKMPKEVKQTLKKMRVFSKRVIDKSWKGYTGKPITDVVNIGIGGSDLGPDMISEALTYYKNLLNTHYISNVDGDHVAETLKKLNPETTIFIIVSKTFTTQETITNASTVRNWFLQKATILDIESHFVAVSTNIREVENFGIASENIFPMWDWVGGRFSLWSAVGLSVCCAVGYS